jgi:hypothetical protein
MVRRASARDELDSKARDSGVRSDFRDFANRPSILSVTQDNLATIAPREESDSPRHWSAIGNPFVRVFMGCATVQPWARDSEHLRTYHLLFRTTSRRCEDWMRTHDALWPYLSERQLEAGPVRPRPGLLARSDSDSREDECIWCRHPRAKQSLLRTYPHPCLSDTTKLAISEAQYGGIGGRRALNFATEGRVREGSWVFGGALAGLAGAYPSSPTFADPRASEAQHSPFPAGPAGPARHIISLSQLMAPVNSPS